MVLIACVPPAAARSGEIPQLRSPIGSYLAGRVARSSNDTEAAVDFYRHALRGAPNDIRILEATFLVEATEGNADRAISLARKIIDYQPQHRLARAWLGIAAFKARKYKTADRHFRASSAGPIGELTGALSRAWVSVRRGRFKEALGRLKSSQRAEWAQYYLRYHRALIADAANRRKLARQNYRAIFKIDARMPRVVVSYLHHAAHAQDFQLGREILNRSRAATTGTMHPAIVQAGEEIEAGKRLPLLIENGADGLAEVYYGLGEALTTEGGRHLGAIYLQMALYLKPDFPFALAALANVFESTKRYAKANAVYDKIPSDSPLQLLIEIRRAHNLNSLDRLDEARTILVALSDRNPEDLRPLDALANMLRVRKKYADAIHYYDRIIELIGKPSQRHWTYWYQRGTCYERIKNWPKAERDLLKANDLSPNEPLVLNYLGYSWVDRNERLKEGLEFIEKAVELKPDDGYIVDSLGWAHFRLGDYGKATKHLERAVELRPADPILNDHLGDACGGWGACAKPATSGSRR